MTNWMRYRIWADGSGVTSIGQEFPVAHRMATVAARVIKERVGLPVGGSEFGSLTVYFRVSLEAVDWDPRLPLQAAVIISTGRVVAEPVRLQLPRLLPLTTQYLLLPPAVTKDRSVGIDLVVTTNDRPVPAPVPVLRVSHTLDRRALTRELNRHHTRLPGSDGGILASALDEQHLSALPPGTDYADAVDYMTVHPEVRGLAE